MKRANKTIDEAIEDIKQKEFEFPIFCHSIMKNYQHFMSLNKVRDLNLKKL